jgi:hypothetical protein
MALIVLSYPWIQKMKYIFADYWDKSNVFKCCHIKCNIKVHIFYKKENRLF